jgi:hypothetical protein
LKKSTAKVKSTIPSFPAKVFLIAYAGRLDKRRSFEKSGKRKVQEPPRCFEALVLNLKI